MNGFWFYLTILLDTYPWLLLQYLPFRGALRLGYVRAVAICTGVLLLWQLGFVWISRQAFYSPGVMLAYRFFQIALLLMLTLALIRSSFAKISFVFCLLYPIMMLNLAAACFVAGFLPARELPTYMVTGLLRLLLSLMMLPFLLWLWRRILIPVMDVQEAVVWRYAWPIPAAFTLISLFYTRNDFEIAGVSPGELLGRCAIFVGTLLTCLLLFRMIRQAQERTRATEEAEKSRLLLETQAAQYRALSGNIESARRFRHDMSKHMAVISELAGCGEMDALKRYAARLEAAGEADRPMTLCANRAANAILSHYLSRAAERGVLVGTQVSIPEDIGVADIDLTIVLGNLMENALEACAGLPESAREIEIKARAQGSRLFLVLSNACGEPARQTPEGLLSRKRDFEQVGVGLQSVRAVCEKYDGEIRFSQKPGRFTASAMLRAR